MINNVSIYEINFDNNTFYDFIMYGFDQKYKTNIPNK